MQFANPELFVLFAIIPILIVAYVLKIKDNKASIRLSSLSAIGTKEDPFIHILRHSPFALSMLAFSFIIIALARPQSSLSWQDVTTEGIDIVLSMDISGSMLAEDLKPNRLEASKAVALDFIKGRPSDRIGLVTFSGESFTQSPLTTDHAVLKNLFKDVKNGMIEDGTAIGMGLATSVNRLRDSDAKSKVVILLTDGSNNSGSIPPITAAEIAREFGVRVYTIGVGTNGKAPFPYQNAFGQTSYQSVEVKIDEKTMQEIADLTGGKYFRATNNRSLAAIYKEIDELEKSKIEVTEYRKKKEEFFPFALIAACLLLLDFGLKNTVLRTIN
ncbi:MAG: VWA domain-containing protein [Bacteroidetes bacterium]|nr:MAG: VWA domain-containing protein [Bacteroidota bacterium]MBL1145289.1 VWA domain-containing protein [Bacteroidota bacterium]NOG58086.1 VWA domain-containing protein [Bacteroidota bacterium]